MGTEQVKLLILGGSSCYIGGVEAFCRRAAAALGRAGGGWRSTQIATDTAYLKLRQLPRFLRNIARVAMIPRHSYDCIWVQYANLPDLIFVLVAKLRGHRVMVTPHLGMAWRSQSNRVLRAFSTLVLRAADRLALISPTQEIELNLPAVPRSGIRNFLPEEVLAAPLPDRALASPTLQLIHSGRLSGGKGSFLVIDVCARLRDLGVPFQMRLTGAADPTTLAALHQRIDRAQLNDQVELLGRIPEADLIAHLQNADVLLHLSKVDSYPLIVLEAMASGALPVCMELAGARDQVETFGGHIVSVDHAVEEAAAWIAQQAGNLPSLRAAGRRIAERVRRDYAWDVCAAHLERALRAALAPPPPASAVAKLPHGS